MLLVGRLCVTQFLMEGRVFECTKTSECQLFFFVCVCFNCVFEVFRKIKQS